MILLMKFFGINLQRKNHRPPKRVSVSSKLRTAFKRPVKAIIEKTPPKVLKHVPNFANIALKAVDSKGRVSADGIRAFGRKSILDTSDAQIPKKLAEKPLQDSTKSSSEKPSS